MSAAGRARGMVADWTLLLVRGLPDAVARYRFDEIAADLWEQQHDAEAHGRSSLGIAASVLLRALRGVPGDLQWRWAVGRRPALRIGGVAPSKQPTPTAKPWVHLTGPERPFDQTNGVVDFDVEDRYDAANVERDLFEKGAAMSMLSVGGLGLGG